MKHRIQPSSLDISYPKSPRHNNRLLFLEQLETFDIQEQGFDLQCLLILYHSLVITVQLECWIAEEIGLSTNPDAIIP